MRIILPFSSPDIEKQIIELDPKAEITVLGLMEGEDVPPDIQADALLTLGVVSREKLEKLLLVADQIRWIHVFGTGVDNFPWQAIGDRELTCSRGAHALPIAEWVMAVLLAAEKQLPESWVSAPPENWHSASLGQLSGQTLALLGYGCIGSLVAERALAFGMKVKVLVRAPRKSWPEGVSAVNTFGELVAEADHLVLAAPATAATHHIINNETLAKCKQGMHLINIARGSLVDQDALKNSLENGTLSRASLDVVDPEPLPEGHWLYEHPLVRLSPHISWSNPSMLEKIVEPFIYNVQQFIEGGSMHGVVNVIEGY